MSPLDKSLLSNAPAIFFLEQGAWRAANADAEALPMKYEWLSLRNGRLVFANPATDKLFRQRVSEPDGNHINPSTNRMPIIVRDKDWSPAGAILLFREHLQSVPGVTDTTPPLIFAIIVPEQRRRSDQTSALVDFGGLTMTEGELIADLLAGLTVHEIALQSERSVSTVRWHIKNILGKIGVSRLDDLYRIAGLLP